MIFFFLLNKQFFFIHYWILALDPAVLFIIQYLLYGFSRVTI